MGREECRFYGGDPVFTRIGKRREVLFRSMDGRYMHRQEIHDAADIVTLALPS
jgi:hypothetical protein